jgi:hypothetical protein
MAWPTSLWMSEVPKTRLVRMPARRVVAAPEAEVAGVGLAAMQTALDVQRRGVSAKKVVVMLP